MTVPADRGIQKITELKVPLIQQTTIFKTLTDTTSISKSATPITSNPKTSTTAQIKTK